MLTRIITITEPSSHTHSKYRVRRRYVDRTLIPSLTAAGFDPVIFGAVTPLQIKVDPPHTHAVFRSLTLELGYGCTANLLSNYELWRLCVESGEPVLVLEDDAFLPAENAAHVKAAVDSFTAAAAPDSADVLYLLSQCPYRKDTLKNRFYGITYADGLVVVDRKSDLSCTAAYVVTPAAARVLMNHIADEKTAPTDGYLAKMLDQGRIKVCAQSDVSRGFMLHEAWADWNHTHNPDEK